MGRGGEGDHGTQSNEIEEESQFERTWEGINGMFEPNCVCRGNAGIKVK